MKLQQIHVALQPASRSYDVMIGAGALALAAPRIAQLASKNMLPVITDQTVADLHLNTLETVMAEHGIETRCLILPPGEDQKSFAGLQTVCDFLFEQEMEREDCLLAFGGGVIGDLAGLASALVKRGTHFVQIPTTLLAQVDSSVGGKTAINTKTGKNMIGVFHQPRLVVADTDFLQTLDPRQWRAGYAEMLKMACLSDRAFFDQLVQTGPEMAEGEAQLLIEAIRRSVQGKADLVAEDELERGRRALLNLGHTFAHGLEAEAPGQILHGEAVAAGMGAAFLLSAELGFCPKEDADQLLAHLHKMQMPTSLKDAPGGPYKAQNLLHRMLGDKKNKDGQIHLVLCKHLGEAFVTADISNQTLLDFMDRNLT